MTIFCPRFSGDFDIIPYTFRLVKPFFKFL